MNNTMNNTMNNNKKDNKESDNNEFDNNEYHIKLYNSVFNNIYLKSIIFHHLNIFNILYPVNILFESNEELQQFQYKGYLNGVKFDYSYQSNFKLESAKYDFKQLPNNIKHIIIPSPDFTNINQIINSIPNHIESFEFIGSLHEGHLKSIKNYSNRSSGSININSTSSAISKFKSLRCGDKDILNLPSSITKLYISGSIDLTLKNRLPSNLKVLGCNILNSFEDGCLPESLTHVYFYQLKDQLLINQVSLNNLIKLDFRCNNINIESNIRFPNSLQDLVIRSCGSFNATLPNSLKSLILKMTRYEYDIQFPSSLEHLDIGFEYNKLNHAVFQSRQSVPINLKSLCVSCSSIVDSDGVPIFPDTLESLTLRLFNQELKENQLPSSLTHLDIDSLFNSIIDINVLPSSLKILELSYDYTKVINPLAIPSTLQLLVIAGLRYNNPIKLTPSSHPNTVIDCHNLNLYYDPYNTDIRVLKLPDLNSPLSTFQLQDKCNLNYLHLGYGFNHPIQLSDLPINNQIKVLEFGHSFIHTINLEYFQNLESIIVCNGLMFSGKSFKITTTVDDYGSYNYYKLKEIQISNLNHPFIKHLDIHFYKFIKLYKLPINKYIKNKLYS